MIWIMRYSLAALCPLCYGLPPFRKLAIWSRMKHPAKLVGLFLLTPIVAASTGTATALSSENSSSIAAVPDTPPPAVEEYNYPGADQIFAEREIRYSKATAISY
ncbi:hypothetical protein GCM10027563_09000 [Parasphingorhabdus pacifica]